MLTAVGELPAQPESAHAKGALAAPDVPQDQKPRNNTHRGVQQEHGCGDNHAAHGGKTRTAPQRDRVPTQPLCP